LPFDLTRLVRRVADELGRSVDCSDDHAVTALARRLDAELRPPRRLPRRRKPVEAYTVDDLLERAPISRTALYSEFKSGRLAARKRAGRVYVLAEDFTRWLATAPPAFGADHETTPRRGRSPVRRSHGVDADAVCGASPVAPRAEMPNG
jgi:hypothetical protein